MENMITEQEFRELLIETNMNGFNSAIKALEVSLDSISWKYPKENIDGFKLAINTLKEVEEKS